MNISYWMLVATFLSVPSIIFPANPIWGSEAGLGQQFAQAPAAPSGRPVRIRGKIIALEANDLRVATASGEVRLKLIEPLRITGVVAAKLSDITPGSFIGTAGKKQADGSFQAVEVHIFPEAMRGAGEGQNVYDLPGTTMTNANVERVEKEIQVEKVEKREGQLLTLKHKGGEVKVIVSPDTPIVKLAPGERELLKPGAGVYIFRAIQAPDGSISAQAVSVGVGGVIPPM